MSDDPAVLDDHHPRLIRAPAEDGELLQVPLLANAGSLLHQHLAVRGASSEPLGQNPPLQIHQGLRSELLERARDYTKQYRDVDFSASAAQSILMAGHQPRLFHPGVWIKNFALSRLAQQHAAVAINLVVDNDLSGSASLPVPVKDSRGAWHNQLVPYDTSQASLPIENAGVVDRSQFASFPHRLREALSPLVSQPMVDKLWAELPMGGSGWSRGALLAAARHRLEASWGLQSWELPISQLAQTHGFAEFVAEIVARLPEFQATHNELLDEFRAVYRIRSQARPVPSLAREGDWIEAPFWVWSSAQPTRQRVFVRMRKADIAISDRAAWTATVTLSRFAEAMFEWHRQGIVIRPRALTTTMFARLHLCDLFIHGIGGAHYDQLGDWIMKRFFAWRPASYLTVSATCRLPLKVCPPDDADASALDRQRRQLWFHPEHALWGDPAAASAVRLKQELLRQIPSPRAPRRSEWHRELSAVNARLRNLLSGELAALDERRVIARARERDTAVVRSRDIAFCCYPLSLGDRLLQMVEGAANSPQGAR